MEVLFIYMLITVAIGYCVENTRSNQLKKIYLLSIFLFAFLYSGLRGKTVGLDTALWNSIFDNIVKNGLSELPRNTEVEKGYMMVNYVLGKIGLPSQSIIILGSAIICCSFYNIIKKYSKNYVLSSLIFISMIFTVTMNVSRQYIALAFLLYAFDAIVQKKRKQAILLILLATSMHYSAIIFLPLVYFASSKTSINRKSVFLIGAVSFSAIPLYMVIVNLFVSIFDQYNRFITSSKYSAELEVSLQYVILFAMVAFLGLIYISPIQLKIRKSKVVIAHNNVIQNVVACKPEDIQSYLLFFLLFIEYIVIYFISRNLLIAARFTYYFQSSLIIVIPNTIYYLKQRYKLKLINVCLMVAFLAYFIYFGYRYFVSDPHGILPYMFFWE